MQDYSTYIWLIIAGILAATEIATGTFYLLMLALAALITWVADRMGAPFLVQTTVFLLASIVLSFFVHQYRRKHQSSDATNVADDLDAGEIVTVSHWQNGIGTTHYRGTKRQVILNDTKLTPVNGQYQIVRFEGNRLLVRPIQS